MKGEEEKEGTKEEGCPGRLPVESWRLCNCGKRRARVSKGPYFFVFHVDEMML